MKGKDTIYLVKVAPSLRDFKDSDALFANTWFFAQEYRKLGNRGGIPLTVFHSRQEAERAIKTEKKLLRQERKSLKKDIAMLKKAGLTQRYKDVDKFMAQRTNPYALMKPLVYKIIPVEKGKWDKITVLEGDI